MTMTDIVPTINLNDAPYERRESLRVNLEDLRGQLTLRLAILLLVVGQLLVLFYDSPVPFPLDMVLYWLFISAVGCWCCGCAAIIRCWRGGYWPEG
jgi:hypothetical protein